MESQKPYWKDVLRSLKTELESSPRVLITVNISQGQPPTWPFARLLWLALIPAMLLILLWRRIVIIS